MTSGTVLKTHFLFVPINYFNRNYTNAMVTMVSWPACNQSNGLITSHLVLIAPFGEELYLAKLPTQCQCQMLKDILSLIPCTQGGICPGGLDGLNPPFWSWPIHFSYRLLNFSSGLFDLQPLPSYRIFSLSTLPPTSFWQIRRRSHGDSNPDGRSMALVGLLS